jgi:hypothetical protein
MECGETTRIANLFSHKENMAATRHLSAGLPRSWKACVQHEYSDRREEEEAEA